MARGWESKSVEEQIQERDSVTPRNGKPRLTPQEIQIQSKRDGLLMIRTRTLTSLQSACDARYRSHLERVLADLDSQLASLGNSAAGSSTPLA